MVIPYRNSILVDAIRELEKEANFLPFEANARIFIIDDADKLSSSLTNAANALLKTLEEPAESTYIFLITSQPTVLLPTIISRCQTIRFAPIASNEIEDHLLDTKEYSSEDAKLLAKLSRGSIADALNLNLADYYQQRIKMLDVLRSLSNKRNFTILLKTSEELSDPKNKDIYENNLEILQTLIHDIWTLNNNADAEIINFDILPNIKQLSETTDNQTLSNWLTEIENLLENLRSNLNRKVATDALFMKMVS
jgi:DNA polymerase-3 subunit delta'